MNLIELSKCSRTHLILNRVWSVLLSLPLYHSYGIAGLVVSMIVGGRGNIVFQPSWRVLTG